MIRFKNKIKLKYKAWNEVPIGLYHKISEICARDIEPLDKNIKLISLLSDTPEQEVWNLEMKEAEAVFSQLQWLWKFDFPKNYNGKNLKIDGQTYTVCVDLKNFTISQYIDFQELWPTLKEDESVLSSILATFIIPEGHKYNTDYDVHKLAKTFDEHLPITTAQSVLYFFLLSLARSIRATEICYSLMMKMMKMRAKTKEEKEKIQKLTEQTMKLIKQAQSIIGSL